MKYTKEEQLRKKIVELKAKKKEPTMAQLKKIVQRKVNEYVRLRDKKLPCISCGRRGVAIDAGHYVAQGSSGLLRYELDNLNGQCQKCNRFLHGNLIEYRIGLVKRIGILQVEWLEKHRHDIKKWTREELNEILSDTKELIRVINLSK
mgnify:FL=1